MDYVNGKVYKLICDDGYFYIGSTTTPLAKRLYHHKRASTIEKTKNSRVYQHINTIGWDRVRIILIEEHQCENKQQLLRKENEYIEMDFNNQLCLNSNRAVQNEDVYKINNIANVKRWRENNLEYFKQQAKERYEMNKEVILAQQKEHVACECGMDSSRGHVSRHRKSAAHLSALASMTTSK
jgi:predicted GIY-YIG superfamily endonuclease